MKKVAVVLLTLGLVISLAGVACYYCYSFQGHFRLTEGESVLEANESYQDLHTGWVRPNPEYRWAIQLEQAALRYSMAGEITEVAASLFFFDQSESKGYQGVAGLGHPVEIGNLEIEAVSIGVTPALDLFDGEGQLVWRGAPKLDILDKQAQKTALFSEAGSEFHISFYPAARYHSGRLINNSLTPTNPVFLFELPAKGISEPIPVGGDPVKLGAYTISIPGYRYWLEFEVSSTVEPTILYIGLVVLSLGLLVLMVTYGLRKIRRQAA